MVMIGNLANGSGSPKRSHGNWSLTEHARSEDLVSMNWVMWSSCFQIPDNSTAKLKIRLETGEVLARCSAVLHSRRGRVWVSFVEAVFATVHTERAFGSPTITFCPSVSTRIAGQKTPMSRTVPRQVTLKTHGPFAFTYGILSFLEIKYLYCE